MQNRNIIGKTENLSKYLTSFTDNLKEEYSNSSFISSKTLIGLQLTSLSLLTSGVINNNTTPAISFVGLGLMGIHVLAYHGSKIAGAYKKYTHQIVDGVVSKKIANELLSDVALVDSNKNKVYIKQSQKN